MSLVEAEIQNLINAEVKKFWNLARGDFEERIQTLVERKIRESPTFKSIVGGALYGEFGDVESSQVMDAVVRSIINNIRVNLIDGDAPFIRVEILETNFPEITTLPEFGGYISPRSGATIDYLRWILFEGTSTIIANYKFVDEPKYRKGSRTGRGIMLRKDSWGINQSDAGTASDNFLTRALAGIESELEKIAKEVFEF